VKPWLRQFLPILVPLLLLAGFFLYKEWEITAAEWKLDRALRENKALKTAIGNLTASETVAYVDVVRRMKNKQGESVELIFSETERGNPNKVIRDERLIAPGELTYFDALVVTFDDELVGDGKRKALFLWKRIFGEQQAPENGYRLDETLPKAYEEISKACERTFFGFKVADHAEEFWDAIWDLANEPEKLNDLGIHSLQGKASSMKLEQGKRYKLTIGNRGRVDVRLEGDSPVIPENPAIN